MEAMDWGGVFGRYTLNCWKGNEEVKGLFFHTKNSDLCVFMAVVFRFGLEAG